MTTASRGTDDRTSTEGRVEASAPGGTVPKAAWITFAVLGVVVVLLSTLGQFTSSVSGLAEVRDDDWLVATFGTGMGLFTGVIAVAGLRSAEAWAWWALAYYPAFFAVHVAVFGTWIPDAGLLVVSVAALAVSSGALRRPRT